MKKKTVKFNEIKKMARKYGLMCLFDAVYSDARRLAPSSMGGSDIMYVPVPSTDALEKKAKEMIEHWYESPEKNRAEWKDFKIMRLGFLATQAMKHLIIESQKKEKT